MMSPLIDPNARPDEANFREMVDYLFQSKRAGVNGLMHGAIGLAGESGEVLDLMKKVWVYDKPFDAGTLDKVEEEMGDVIHYFFMLMLKLEEITGHEYSLSDFFRNNMIKLRKRYPDGFTKEAALRRADQTPQS